MTGPHYIIRGVGGSQAHGLAHEGSDIDYRGVYSYKTEAFFRLTMPAESLVTTSPEADSQAHELKKWLHLASKGNPDAIETLALDTYVDFDPEWGPRLLELQPALLAEAGVRASYAGYAMQQFRALQKSIGIDDHQPTFGTKQWKLCKHIFRLLESGERILTTGKIVVKVDNPDWFLEKLPQLTYGEVFKLFEAHDEQIKNAISVLPIQPDYRRINDFLVEYRKAH